MSKKKIRKLKGDEDLFELFGCEEDDDSSDATEKDVKLNKHGLPVIEKRLGNIKGKSREALLEEKGIVRKKIKNSLQKKINNYPAPQAELDLHGDIAMRAEIKADYFIRSSLSNDLLTLRIIVGKGTHSEFGAVLPDVIEDLIIKLKREKIVLSYRWEKKIKRKSGAIIVYLP